MTRIRLAIGNTRTGKMAKLFIDEHLQPQKPFDPNECLDRYPSKEDRDWHFSEMPEEAKAFVFGLDVSGQTGDLEVPYLERQDVVQYEIDSRIDLVRVWLANGYSCTVHSSRCFWDLQLLGETAWWEKWGNYVYHYANHKFRYDPSLDSDWGGFGFGSTDLR